MNKICLACGLTVVFAASVTLLGVHSGGLAAPTSGFGNGKSLTQIKYYDVTGTSLDELRRDVFSRGPYDSEKDQRFAGWAEWKIQWRFDRKEMSRGCSVLRAETEAHVYYTLPRWVDADRAPPELQQTWKSFIDALVLHEEGHGELARELAENIKFAIESLPPEATCTELDQTVNELANRMILEDTAQEEYDRRTGHGKTQGAAFPSVVAASDAAAASSKQ